MREKREFRIRQLISGRERAKEKWKVKGLLKSTVEENRRNNTNSIGCNNSSFIDTSRNNNKFSI